MGGNSIGPLQDPVTWYRINYSGTQIAQWDFQDKEKSGWTGKSSFVLEVRLRYLRPSVIYSVPCDQILQGSIGAYKLSAIVSRILNKKDAFISVFMSL